MKKTLFALLASLFLICNTGYATIVLPAVKWQLGETGFAGGIKFENMTNKKQYIQIVVNQGVVDVYTINSGAIHCETLLMADTSQASKICRLNPKDKLYIDLDIKSKSAFGNYQVAIVN